MNYSDLLTVLVLCIAVWLAIESSGGMGGGHRSRVLARIPR